MLFFEYYLAFQACPSGTRHPGCCSQLDRSWCPLRAHDPTSRISQSIFSRTGPVDSGCGDHIAIARLEDVEDLLGFVELVRGFPAALPIVIAPKTSLTAGLDWGPKRQWTAGSATRG